MIRLPMNRPAVLWCLLMVCPCRFSVAQEEPSTTLKVDVRMVNVFVTGIDAKGASISLLTKDNFKLSEDGIEQKISVFDKESTIPHSSILAVDTRLSTKKAL